MCGIAGIVSYRLPQQDLRQKLGIMIDRLSMRGPDGDGAWHDQFIALGHTRLAIIDLHIRSNQPFIDRESGKVIVFNGEIYNYRELREELVLHGFKFYTESDTEVFLKAYIAWGEGSLSRFIGMWAAAIYDPLEGKLFISRDRFGIKPLYISITSECVFFASTISAILVAIERSPEPDLRTVYRYLMFGEVDSAETTFFKGIIRFPHASHATLDVRAKEFRISPVCYWDPKAIPSQAVPLNEGKAIEEFRAKLFDSVRLHLRADVEIAACLSGGIDSSSLVSAASMVATEKGMKLSAVFTACFDEEPFNEYSYAAVVAARYGLEHVVVKPNRESFIQDVLSLVEVQEEPFGSTGIFVQWKVFEAIARAGYKVAIDGQGSDEYLVGYITFLIPYILDAIEKCRLPEAGSALLAVIENSFRHGHFGSNRRYVRGVLGRVMGRQLSPPGKWCEEFISSEMMEACFWEPPEGCGNGSDRVKRATLGYLTRYSLPSLLRYEDRNSMCFGIEARVPFLDHRLVEYALGLPVELLLRGRTTKWILRQAMKGTVPQEILSRRDKLGFANPGENWIASHWHELTKSRLDREALKKYFTESYIDRHLIRGDLGPAGRDVSSGWRILNIVLWDWALNRSL